MSLSRVWDMLRTWVRGGQGAAGSSPPYRRVVERFMGTDGEHILLECGHSMVLHVRRRGIIPCEECLNTAAHPEAAAPTTQDQPTTKETA